MNKCLKFIVLAAFIGSLIFVSSCSTYNTKEEVANAIDYKAANEAANAEIYNKANEVVPPEIVDGSQQALAASKVHTDAALEPVILTEELEKVTVMSDKVELLIPKAFTVMSDDDAEVKYPADGRPTIIYTNKSGTINIAFALRDYDTISTNLYEYVLALKIVFVNQFPAAQVNNWGLKTINGSTVGVIEIITPALDTDIYNSMWLTDLDGKLLIATFNCTIEEMDYWKPISEQIINSFKVL